MSDTTIAPNDFLPAPIRAVTPYLLLALAILAAYGNIYDNQFLFDDDLLITLNSFLNSWHNWPQILAGSTTGGAHIAGGFYRPVQITLYLIIKQVFDGSLFWFHFLNLSLHIANACLMFRIGEKLKFNLWGVFLASLIWGLHALHTEAVTYMSATADPLFSLFALWSIAILLPDITMRKIWMVFPLFLLGLFSKETMSMFPLLVMACLFYTHADRFNYRIYLRTWPLWLVSLAFVYWRSHAQGFDGPQTYDRYYALPAFANLKLYADHPIYRIYTFFATLPSYLELLLWPHDLHMERSFPVFVGFLNPPVLEGFAMVAAACAQIFYAVRRNAPSMSLSWGFLWFAAAHAPDMGILIPMNALFLEHWMYLPTVGLFLGLGQSVTQLLQKHAQGWRYACAAIALCFAGFLAILTYQQNEIWQNPETFYKNIFSHHEISARSRNNLALYYAAHGRQDEALEEFGQATKITDSYAETRYNIAISYLQMPDHKAHLQQAIDNLNRSLEIDPKFYRSYILLSKIYGTILGDKEKAAAYQAQADALMPRQQQQ